MIYIFFVYGLAFFSMGLAILLIPKRGSAFSFARDLWLIAAFGLSHGACEWLDMFILIEGPRAATSLGAARTLMLPLSFLFLVLFFVRSAQRERPRPWLRAVPWALCALWAAAAARSARPLLAGDIWARYLLAAPGALLASWTLLRQSSHFGEMRLPAVSRRLRVAAGAFLLYGLFAALFVPEADFFPASALNYRVFTALFIVPVQVFRTLCGVVLAVSMSGVLSLFDYQTQEIIKGRAYRDPLTGLPNRLLLNDRVEQAILHAHRFRRMAAVMMLDLDRFKNVNDTRGHDAGDRLLRSVGERLTGLLRRSDTVARLGGDEFIIVLPDVDHEEEALAVGWKILQACRKPYACAGGDLRVTASIGVALYPLDGTDVGLLLKNADSAMYLAKDLGRDTCQSLRGPSEPSPGEVQPPNGTPR